MALPAFNNTKHSIGLGDESENVLGFMVSPGSYRRGVQERGSQLITIGTRLLQDGKVSQWSQFDFSGGEYQEYFDDEKMYHWSDQLKPSDRGRKALQVTQAMEWCVSNIEGNIDLNGLGDPYGSMTMVVDVISYGNILYVLCSDGKLFKFTIDDGLGMPVFDDSSATVAAGKTASALAYNPNTDHLIVGFTDGHVEEIEAVTLAHVRAWHWDNAAKTHTYMPTGWTRACTRITIYSSYVVVGMGDRTFYYSATDVTTTEDGDGHCTSCAWTYIGSTFGQVQAFVEHQGLLLALTCYGQTQSYIYSTSLTANLALWMKIPYIFYAQCITSYAGRVYVGGSGGAGSAESWGEIYEIDGSSFRLLKSYRDLLQREGYPTFSIGGVVNFTVYEGGLYFANGTRNALECYDFIGDAFFTVGKLPDDAGTYPVMTYVSNVGGALVCLTTPDGGMFAVAATHSLGTAMPTFEASEYKVEPLLLKKWVTAQVYSYNSAWIVEVSSDGGAWTEVPSLGAEVVASERVEAFDLSNIVPSHGLRMRVTLDPTSITVDSPCLHELEGVALGFIIVPPRLLQWNMSIQAMQNSEELDGDVDQVTDPDEIISQLWSWFTNVDTLTYIDRDGVSRNVLITAIQETEPQMLGDTNREAFLTVTLSELGVA
jgi:hypothetical protein